MNDIVTRAVTGFFFLIVMIGGVVLHEYSYLILFSLLVVLCISEYHAIIHDLLTSTEKWKTTYKIINTVFSVIIFGIVFLVAKQSIPLISLSSVMWFSFNLVGDRNVH
jgi:phosphatidate cytidylyltransferase